MLSSCENILKIKYLYFKQLLQTHCEDFKHTLQKAQQHSICHHASWHQSIVLLAKASCIDYHCLTHMHVCNFCAQKKINGVEFRTWSAKTQPHISLLPQWIEDLFFRWPCKKKERERERTKSKYKNKKVLFGIETKLLFLDVGTQLFLIHMQ